MNEELKQDMAKRANECCDAWKLNQNLDNALKDYPDLTVKTDRWGRKYYCSEMANDKVEQVSFGASCGCCSDSPIYAYFSLNHGGIMIYSNPFRITIGERVYGGGINAYDNWEKEAQTLKIPQVLIKKVREYLDKNSPSKYNDDEESDEDL